MRRTSLPQRLPFVAACLILCLAAVTASASAQASSIDYQLVNQWPSLDRPLDEVVGTEGLAATVDGTVFLSDSTSNRITMMAPDGTWVKAFGNTGRGPDRLGNPRRIEVSNAGNRLFVADTDSYRIVVFDLAGNFVDAWRDIYAAGMSIGPDGRLWVADVLRSQIRVFDLDGQEVMAFGERGSGAGKFRQLQDVSVAPSGDVYVGDRNGQRIQVFHVEAPIPLAAALRQGSARSGAAADLASPNPADQPVPAPADLRLVRALDLTDAKYRQAIGGGGGGAPPPPGGGPGAGRRTRSCSSSDLAVVDDDTFFAFPCLVKNGEVTFLRGPQASTNVSGFFLPFINPATGQYYSMGVYDEDRMNNRNPTYPAVIHYTDDSFSTVTAFWKLATFDFNRFRNPSRVDVHPNGTLYITDFRGVQRYASDGTALNYLPVSTYPSNALSITLQAATGDGTADGIVGFGRCLNAGSANAFQQPCVGYFLAKKGTYQGNNIDYLEPVWTTTGPEAAKITAIHYDPVNDYILLLNNDDQMLMAYGRLQYGRRKEWPLGGADRTVYFAEVGSGPDGKIYVLDALRDEIQVRDVYGKLVRTLQGPSDAWRLSGGPNGTVFVLTAFGEVVRLDETGKEEARFQALPNENAQAKNLSDLSVGADGGVFVADRQASLISEFQASGLPPTRVLAGQTCLVQGDKKASPSQVPLGSEVGLALTVVGSCGSVEEPSNVLILVNTKSASALTSAKQVISLANFKRHTIGLMGYYVNTLFKVRWTQNVFKIITGLDGLNAGGGSESNEANALREAKNELSVMPGRGVVVLIGAQYCVKADRPDCPEQTDAEPVAEELRKAGIRVVVVNAQQDASLLATSDLDSVSFGGNNLGGAVPVYQRVASFLHPKDLLKTGVVHDVIPANMEYVLGSAVPAAAWDPASRTLTWNLKDTPYSSMLRYRLRPMAGGRWPTNVEAHAEYTDGWDGTGQVTFPVPEIDVLAPPTLTPTPTATATEVPTETPIPTVAPPTETPVPTPTSKPRPLFLPVLLFERCKPRVLAQEVVLVVDTSSSMTQSTLPGGPTKLDAARAAALALVQDGLNPEDRVALVTFDGAARTLLPLSADRQAASDALAGMAHGTGSRIDLGLLEARRALAARRDGASSAVILLTDGRPTIAEATVLAAAKSVQDVGTLIYAIGLGSDVDMPLLGRVAGNPSRAYAAPDVSDLPRIYAGLPVVEPCQ